MAYASLHDRLRGPIAAALQRELTVANRHALPQIEKITVNVGINHSKMEGKEFVEHIADVLSRITGQKPSLRLARKSIANFKIREGVIVGAMVTLRGRRMEGFLDRLLHVVLPRTRDFRGLSPLFDGHGNYALGIPDYSVFPEVPPPPDVRKLFGLQVQVTTTAGNDAQACTLLRAVGFPFRALRSIP